MKCLQKKLLKVTTPCNHLNFAESLYAQFIKMEVNMNEEQISIKEILHVPIGAIAKYKVEQLYELLNEAAGNLEQVKRTKQWIESAVALKYEEQVKAKRLRLEKDIGVIHLEDGGFKLTSEVAKKVEWDQMKLAKIAATIAVNGGVLSDYVESYYHVPESKYNSWSETIKNLFVPARTLTLGKASYRLTRLTGEAGL